MAAPTKAPKAVTDADMLLARVNELGRAGECNSAEVHVAADAFRERGDGHMADFFDLLSRLMYTVPDPEFDRHGTPRPPMQKPVVTFGRVWWRVRLVPTDPRRKGSVYFAAARPHRFEVRDPETGGWRQQSRHLLRWLTPGGLLGFRDKRLVDVVFDREEAVAVLRERAGRRARRGH
jgi:hypothetical protein